MVEIGVLLLAGFVAGAVNAVAGGGKLVVLPALIASGLTTLSANITASLVLWPGAAGAAWEYRQALARVPRKYYLLLLPCYAGAFVGMVALQNTSNELFEKLAPWLILVAVLLFALQPFMVKHVALPLKKRPRYSLALIGMLLFGAAVYGGYFGAGFGFVVLAVLGFSSLKSVYQLSAIKNLAASGMEILGVLYFAASGSIAWRPGLIAMVGCIVGGVAGARWAQRLPEALVRSFIILVGAGLAILAFARAYLNL